MRKTKVILAALLVMPAFAAHADIIFGGYAFDDKAFADDATVLEGGNVSLFGGASDVDDALTGFSPTKAVVNIGFSSNANLFQLDFIDLFAANLAGSDLVFFDAAFSRDPYSIAVRELGGAFTSFVDFLDLGSYTNTGETGPLSSTLFALEIDLDLFGLGSGAIVDAIQFRALPNAGGGTEGDPVMAAVLNSADDVVQVPEPGTLALLGIGLFGMGLARRKKA